MKRQYSILCVSLFFCFSLSAQQKTSENPYYYFHGEKVYLSIDYSRISVTTEGNVFAPTKMKNKAIATTLQVRTTEKSDSKQQIILLDGITKNTEAFTTEIELGY